MSDVLNSDTILQVFDRGTNPLSDLVVLESVDSTNEWCLEQCREGRALPFACVTDKQTRGRGRRGRQWYSAPGASITLSIAWAFDVQPDRLGMLSLAMGMAVADVLRANDIEGVMLKWPNDVLVNQKKIAGILIETVTVSGRLDTVIGIGLNYDMKPNALPEPGMDMDRLSSIDFCQSLGREYAGDRNRLIGALINECAIRCERYMRDHDSLPGEFDSRYNAYLNVPINVISASGDVVEGQSLGVTTNGELRVLVEDEERIFNSAEISLRRGAEC